MTGPQSLEIKTLKKGHLIIFPLWLDGSGDFFFLFFFFNLFSPTHYSSFTTCRIFSDRPRKAPLRPRCAHLKPRATSTVQAQLLIFQSNKPLSGDRGSFDRVLIIEFDHCTRVDLVVLLNRRSFQTDAAEGWTSPPVATSVLRVLWHMPVLLNHCAAAH